MELTITNRHRGMRTQSEPLEVEIVLSERNLQYMLSKVQRKGSACTLERELESGDKLILKGERDDAHYKDRPAGLVHPADDPRNQRGKE